MEGLGSAVGQIAGIPQKAEGPFPEPHEVEQAAPAQELTNTPDAAVAEADNAVQEAIEAAQRAAVSSRSQQPATPAVGSTQDTVPPATPPAQQQ
jgi:hypothetical protein